MKSIQHSWYGVHWELADTILEPVIARRKSLDITVWHAAHHLHHAWERSIFTTQYIIRDNLESGAYLARICNPTNKSYLTRKKSAVQKTSQRLSDYLHFLGFSQAASMSVFEELSALSRDITYCIPNTHVSVHPKAHASPLSQVMYRAPDLISCPPQKLTFPM